MSLGAIPWYTVAASDRLLERLRAPVVTSENRRVERVLATARTFLASCCLVAIYLDHTQPSRYAELAYGLLVLYVFQSFLILGLLRFGIAYSGAFGKIVHAGDVLWPVLLTVFTEGPSSPFFVLFAFVLLAAAYRWGFRETMATAAAAVALLLVEGLLMTVWAAPTRGFLEGEFELNRFIIRSTHLLIVGFLLGYLAEQEKIQRAETATTARILEKAQRASGLRKTLRVVLGEILSIFGGKRALLAVEDAATGSAFLWEAVVTGEGREPLLTWTELTPSQRETYLRSAPAQSCFAARRSGGGFDVLAMDREGRRLRNPDGAWSESLLATYPFRAVLAASITSGKQWSGRLFLLDPGVSPIQDAELDYLQNLVDQLSTTVHNAYLVGRLRSQAGAMERARVARELHDGAVQSLIAAEMRVGALERQAPAESTAVELREVRELLRQEVLSLRELMEQIKPLELGPERLVEFLADQVEKFRRETGISARFICDFEEIPLGPRSCRELGRIVQEALANVRRHSEARNVLVRLARESAQWKLVIDDDGRGFSFSGRLSLPELDASRAGPVVIKERVRSMGGDLTIESAPGRGARLEITLP